MIVKAQIIPIQEYFDNSSCDFLFQTQTDVLELCSSCLLRSLNDEGHEVKRKSGATELPRVEDDEETDLT